MAFTKSLYYPWIDIKDESWLKTAALYWDTIQSIVPESIEHPYSSDTAVQLQDESILSPLRVHSYLDEIEGLAKDVVEYLDSQEGMELITGISEETVYLHPDKLPHSLRHFDYIHPGKMSSEVRYMLQDAGLGRNGHGDFLEVDNKFAAFYMTLLATKLSETNGSGLVTSNNPSHNLSLKVRADSKMNGMIGRRMHRHDYYIGSKRLTQGMLLELLLEDIVISPDTPVKKIIDFRIKYSSELGRFRTIIADLTEKIPDDLPIKALRQHISDLHINEVKPAIDDLKKSLTGNRIKWLTNGWLKIAFVSVGSSSMLINAGLSTPNALMAGAGISLIGTGIIYNEDRKSSIRNNPYSYLLNVDKKFGV